MLATDEMRAWYGHQHVALASDRGAIGTLLISDELFRLVSLLYYRMAFTYIPGEQIERSQNAKEICRIGRGRATERRRGTYLLKYARVGTT
jgi:hypothetical protein